MTDLNAQVGYGENDKAVDEHGVAKVKKKLSARVRNMLAE